MLINIYLLSCKQFKFMLDEQTRNKIKMKLEITLSSLYYCYILF